MKVIDYIIITCFISLSLNNFGQNPQNYFIKYQGDTVFMYENPAYKNAWSENNIRGMENYKIHGEFLSFFNTEKKREDIKQKEVKEMLIGGRFFESRSLNGKKKLKRLQEVIITTKSFSFTQYWGNDNFILLIWGENNVLIKRFLISEKLYNDKKIYDKYIKPNIENCQQIRNQIESNFKENYSENNSGLLDYNNMFYKVNNEKCN